MLQGLAFGLIFLNSAAAIVTYFVVPIAFSAISTSVRAPAGPTCSRGSTSVPPSSRCSTGDHMSGEQWAQLATGTLIWVVLPFVVGLWRVLRAEVK